MDFENRPNRGSVRRLRDRFEQNASNNCINCNNNCVDTDYRKTDKTNECIHKNDEKDKSERKRIELKPIIVNNSFAEKLNKTLSNDKKNALNLKTRNSATNAIILPKPAVNVNLKPSVSSSAPEALKFSKPPKPVHKPPPKPPRTFAHDVYLELKFSKSKDDSNSDTNNVNKNKILELYSVPNKATKWENRRNRSQSDSQVMDNRKSSSESNENIYDDIAITDTKCDKTFRSKLFKHFSCLKLKFG